jgi:hypothetical protein
MPSLSCSQRLKSACNDVYSFIASDGKRLTDLYGHLPGYWIHPSLVISTFIKNVTKWNGAKRSALCCTLGVLLSPIHFAAGEPTDKTVRVRGVKAMSPLKKGTAAARSSALTVFS